MGFISCVNFGNGKEILKFLLNFWGVFRYFTEIPPIFYLQGVLFH